MLAALTLPAALVFTQHAFGDRVQGNWPAILYPAAAIAAAGLQGRVWQRLQGPALALGFGITLIVYLQAGLAPVPLPVRLDPIALRLSGWDTLAAQIAEVRRQTGADFVAADQYGVAAELALGLPPGIPVVGIEPRWALFDLPHPTLAGRTGILVRSARRGDVDYAVAVVRYRGSRSGRADRRRKHRRGVPTVSRHRAGRFGACRGAASSAMILPDVFLAAFAAALRSAG